MTKKNLLLAVACLLFIAVPHASGNKKDTVYVSDFNAHPNSYIDAVASVANALEECKKTGAKVLSFPEGRYDFWHNEAIRREYFVSNTSNERDCPSKVKNIGILAENIKDLTIEGNGSLFVFHGKMITWAFDHCENITMRNVSMDFERPMMSEMTFDKVEQDYVIMNIHQDSKYDIIDGKLNFYGEGWEMYSIHSIIADVVNGRTYYSNYNPILNGKATELAPYKVRIDGDFRRTNYAPGRVLTVRDHIRDHVGAFVNRSKNVKLENVTMHYMHGLGIVSQFSENLTYKNVNVVPWRGRVMASGADGMHISGCRGDILIEDCHFSGMHDDPINVHGTYLQITEIMSPTKVRLRFMHHQTYGFPAFFEGDEVAFVTAAALETKGTTTLKKADLVSEREMIVELADPLPKGIDLKDCLENLTWSPNLVVRNSRFEMTNTRGVLISSPRKVLVENNTFYRTGMYGLQIACDANNWFESGAVRDVLVRNNDFIECGYNQSNTQIGIVPENPTIAPGYWVNRNIRIEDNVLVSSKGPIMTAKSTSGLTFTGNEISVTNKDDVAVSPVINLNNCTKVVIKGNKVESGMPLDIQGVNMVKKDVKSDSGQLEIKK